MSEHPVVVVLHGPAGVGKDTVINALREKIPIYRATSSTSRPPRPNEHEGADYYFLSEKQFEDKIAAGDFIEWARVYDEWKGLETKELVGPLERGEDVIIRTNVDGARTWRRKLRGAVFIFLTAEDREALKARLAGRGTEDAATLAKRTAEVEQELADIDNNDYVVVNHKDAVDETVAEIARIVACERANPTRPHVALIP